LRAAFRQAPIGILGLGLIMAAQSGSFFEALARIPLGVTVAIEFIGPLSVALIASRRLLDLLCVLLAGAGIALLTPSIGSSLDPVGVMLAFGAAAGWACFILLSRRLGQVVEGGAGLALAMAIAGLVLFPIAGVGASGMSSPIPERSLRSWGSSSSPPRSCCCSSSWRSGPCPPNDMAC
jgi:inner membrane transporter RhtA